MKLLVAITLVVVAMASAEPPNRNIFQRQIAAPYQPKGWRPNGPSFTPTTNFQRQELAEPSPSYGPPPSVSYGLPERDSTTTVEPITTEAITASALDLQGEDIKSGLLDRNQKAEKLKNEPQPQPGSVYVVLPQGQNVVYTTSLKSLNAALIASKQPESESEVIKEPKLAPVQAVPALAKIQTPVVSAQYAQIPQVVQFQQIQAVPYVKYYSYMSQYAVHTPYHIVNSDSFIQVDG